MFSAAVLHTIEEAGHSVLILSEGVERDELLRSRLTRAEVCRQLAVLGSSIAQLPPAAHSAMPEIGWDGWRATVRQLALPGREQDDALWFAVQSLVPATLMWLQVYRESQPGLFNFSA